MVVYCYLNSFERLLLDHCETNINFCRGCAVIKSSKSFVNLCAMANHREAVNVPAVFS